MIFHVHESKVLRVKKKNGSLLLLVLDLDIDINMCIMV